MTFRTFLLLAIGSVATIPFLGFSLIEIDSADKRIEQNQQVQSRYTDEIARLISMRISNARAQIKTLSLVASEALLDNDSKTSHEILRQVFESTARNFPIFENIHIDDANHISVVYYPPFNDHHESNEGQDHSHRWHARALTAPPGSTLVSPVFLGKGAINEPTINIASAIYSYTSGKQNHDGLVAGRPIGILSSALRLNALADSFQNLQVIENYDAMLVDQLGQVIYSSSGIQPFTKVFTPSLLSRLSLASTPIITSAPGSSERTIVVSAQKVPDTNWTILVYKDAAAYQRDIEVIKNRSLQLILCILLLTFGLAYLVSDQLNRAIRKLTAHLASGQATPLPEHRVIFPKELKLFQTQYTRIKHKLNIEKAEIDALNKNLEKEVEERTAEIRMQHATLNALFEDMREGVILFETNGKLLSMNDEACALLKNMVSDDIDSSTFCKTLGFNQENNKLQLCSLNGQVFEVLRFAIVPREETLASQGFIIREVTEREALKQLKEQLLSTVAHELKTPVHSIKLQSESLLKAVTGKENWTHEEISEVLWNLKESSDYLQKLISDILDVAKIDSGLFHLEKSLVHLPVILRKAKRLLLSTYPTLVVEAEFEENAECLNADKQRITQLFINLLSNAARYAKQANDASEGYKPTVKIKATRQSNNITISFEDNGIGIEPANIKKIFDRFYKVDMTSKRRSGGTGLGLVIVQAICRAHGGDITVSSTPGKGTTFVVTLLDETQDSSNQ